MGRGEGSYTPRFMMEEEGRFNFGSNLSDVIYEWFQIKSELKIPVADNWSLSQFLLPSKIYPIGQMQTEKMHLG